MKIKFPLSSVNLSSHLRDWAVPLVSVATFIPLWVVYLTSSGSETPSARPPEAIPSPSPLGKAAPTAIADIVARTTLPAAPKPLQPPAVRPSPERTVAPVRENTTPVPTPRREAAAPKPVARPSKPVAGRSPVRRPLVVPVGYTAPALEIRVAIERDASSVGIGVSGQAIVTDRQGRGLKTLVAGEGLQVTPSGSGLQMGESSLPEVIFVRPTERDGLVYVNDRWYRGKVLIAAREKGILVVNHVDLEEYLYSVVGSEMHSTAPSEALKAQAIAARSYALVHMIRPASPWFNLGNTQRWQVYKGIGSEYQSSHNAVNATAGQILSYKGGVVESLYAATDEIVSWAHGGRGMSQTGAYQLADRGYDHQQILANYYPGVSVARLILQQ